MQVSVENQSPLGKSDHNVITIKFYCYVGYTKPKDRMTKEIMKQRGKK